MVPDSMAAFFKDASTTYLECLGDVGACLQWAFEDRRQWEMRGGGKVVGSLDFKLITNGNAVSVNS